MFWIESIRLSLCGSLLAICLFHLMGSPLTFLAAIIGFLVVMTLRLWKII